MTLQTHIKQFIFLSFLLFNIVHVYGQACEFTNGNMETWTDYTDIYRTTFENVGIILPDSIILLPAHISPSAIRPQLAINNSLQDTIDILETEEDLPRLYETLGDIFGISRSTDASEGQYALQIGGDFLHFGFIDVGFNFDCIDDIPANILLDVKHISSGKDKLNFVFIIGNESISTLDFITTPEIQELTNTSRYFAFDSLVVTERNVYETFRIPLMEGNMEIIPTNASLLFFYNQDATSFAEGGHYLIDNIRLDNVVSNTDISFHETLKVYPTIIDQHISIVNKNGPLQVYIYDLMGKLVTTFKIEDGHSSRQLDELQHAGYYTIQFVDKASNRQQTFPIIKQ